MSADATRYAEGQREAAECRHCGSPIWIVYHGPRRNHTVKPRDGVDLRDEAQAEVDRLRAALEHIRDSFGPTPAEIARTALGEQAS